MASSSTTHQLGGSPGLTARQLLSEIARCPVFMRELEQAACASILDVQKEASVRQPPEPWSGDFEHAPILFISSDPSIWTEERYPTAEWPDDLVEDFFGHRFGGGQESWVANLHTLLEHPRVQSPRHVSFWASARARATELLGRWAEPGIDFCLTEVVHCKSEGEEGVWQAAEACADRYLARILALSPSAVIVIFGDRADQQVRRVCDLPAAGQLVRAARAGRPRLFAFLPHPNARRKLKTLEGNFAPDEVSQLRAALNVALL